MLVLHSHLSHTLVDVCVFVQSFHLRRSQLKHSNVPLFSRHSSLDDVDFALSCEGLCFNFLSKLTSAKTLAERSYEQYIWRLVENRPFEELGSELTCCELVSESLTQERKKRWRRRRSSAGLGWHNLAR